MRKIAMKVFAKITWNFFNNHNFNNFELILLKNILKYLCDNTYLQTQLLIKITPSIFLRNAMSFYDWCIILYGCMIFVRDMLLLFFSRISTKHFSLVEMNFSLYLFSSVFYRLLWRWYSEKVIHYMILLTELVCYSCEF